jgi:mannonate dehydratase
MKRQPSPERDSGVSGPDIESGDRMRNLLSPRIEDISVIATEPAGYRLTIVKVRTDQDGLYGYGCATFSTRADAVIAVIERFLKPLLLGRPADRIEDIWQACWNSSYLRNDTVLNDAISGIDEALWDIKGRQAGLPVYQLLGGKCREAVECYGHAAGAEIAETIDSAQRLMDQGFRHVRVQVGVPHQAAYASGGGKNYGGGAAPALAGRGNTGALHDGLSFEPADYMRRTLKMLEACRKRLGDEVELLHDVHERILPSQALQFAGDVRPFRLFFLEDPVSPEDLAWLRIIRGQCSTPLAMGELFHHPHEWMTAISERLIDFIRVHLSHAGGLTPCRKIAVLAEQFGVRTAWHGPPTVSPVGRAANLALELTCPNFGIAEWTSVAPERVQEVFQGCPVLKNGYVYANERPGWGIEVDEKAAARYPFGSFETGERRRLNGGWGEVRRRDGTLIKQ